jgi:hypothetical protein
MKRDKTYITVTQFWNFHTYKTCTFTPFVKTHKNSKHNNATLNPIIKALKTKNISAEGGKMVAKRRRDRVEKEICIF